MMTTADRMTLLEAVRTRKGSGEFGYGITTADRYVAPAIEAIGKELARCSKGSERLIKRASETLTVCTPDFVNERRAQGVADMKQLLGMDPPEHAMIAMVNRLTTPKEDRDGDTLQTAGARLDPKAPLLWQHVHTLPIGNMMRILKQDAEVLKVATVLLDINELTSDAAKLVEAEALRFSHGFIPLKFEERKGGPLARFNILEYDIVEESLVSVPSNTDAEIEMYSRGKLASDCFKAHAKALFDARTKQSPGFTIEPRYEGGVLPKGNLHEFVKEQFRPKASPILRKMFDIATQRVEPSSMECDWAARFIGCSVKDLHVHTTAAGGLYMGALLEGFDVHCHPDTCLDTRNIGDGNERPPQFETVELNSKSRKNFLIEGIRFYASEEGHKYVVRTWQGFGTQNFVVYAETAEKAQEPIDEAWKFVNDLNPLKGEAFALTGGFIPKDGTCWEDVFLTPELEKSLKRTVRILNEKGADCANRGLLMAGPPGTGKTLSARVMLNEADATFIWVSPKDFYQGGGFCEAFQLARALAPSILMFEDIDNWMSDYTIDLFKTEMDGLQKSSGVVTILTTNFPDRLPSALIDRPGRFHDVLEIHLPDRSVRLRMLQKWAADAGLESLAKMADDTDGYSGAHLYELCHFAKVVRDEDECSLDDALVKAFSKVKEQRELINQSQLAGSSYRPGRREWQNAITKGLIKTDQPRDPDGRFASGGGGGNGSSDSGDAIDSGEVVHSRDLGKNTLGPSDIYKAAKEAKKGDRMQVKFGGSDDWNKATVERSHYSRTANGDVRAEIKVKYDSDAPSTTVAGKSEELTEASTGITGISIHRKKSVEGSMLKTNNDGGVSSGTMGPVPNTGEAQASFMDRCMLDANMMGNYPTESDRMAACKIQWTSGKPAGKAKDKPEKAMGTCKECGEKDVMLNDDGMCKECAEPKVGNDSDMLPGTAGAHVRLEQKAGRVLSKKNEAKLMDAIDDLDTHDKIFDLPKTGRLLARSARGKVKEVVDLVGGENPVQELSVDHVIAGAIEAAGEDRAVRDRLRKALDALDKADEFEQIADDFRVLTSTG